MKTVGANYEVFNAFAEDKEGPHRNAKETVYFHNHETYDVLYSYGSHFPLCYRFQPEHPIYHLPNTLNIINGDFYSPTTRQHQSDIQSALRGQECFTTSFSALRQADIELLRSKVIDYTEDTHMYAEQDSSIKESDVPLGATAFRNADGYITRWHMAASMVIEYEDNQYICGMDEGSYFVSQLPVKVTSVEDAFEALKPEAVKEAEHKGIQVKRQGEWFCIPHLEGKEAKALYKAMTPNFVLPLDSEGSNPHTATRGIIDGDHIFISGSLRHTEHSMLRLSIAKAPIIWECFKNTAIDSWSARGVD